MFTTVAIGPGSPIKANRPPYESEGRTPATAGACALLLSLELLTGCGGTDCTLIEGLSGFNISVKAPALPTGAVPTFEICLYGSDCRTLKPDPGYSNLAQFVILDDRLTGPASVQVTVNVFLSAGDRIAGGTTSARLFGSELNGPGCGTSWTANLTVDGDRVIAT